MRRNYMPHVPNGSAGVKASRRGGNRSIQLLHRVFGPGAALVLARRLAGGSAAFASVSGCRGDQVSLEVARPALPPLLGALNPWKPQTLGSLKPVGATSVAMHYGKAGSCYRDWSRSHKSAYPPDHCGGAAPTATPAKALFAMHPLGGRLPPRGWFELQYIMLRGSIDHGRWTNFFHAASRLLALTVPRPLAKFQPGCEANADVVLLYFDVLVEVSPTRVGPTASSKFGTVA
jgi:hypothetical protein